MRSSPLTYAREVIRYQFARITYLCCEIYRRARFYLSSPSKNRFAKILAREAKRVGIPDDLGYHARVFSVRLGASRVRLADVYTEYCLATTKEARRAVILEFLAPYNPSVHPLEWALKTMFKGIPLSSLQALHSATDEELARMHWGLGMWVRNYLGLWTDSRLTAFLAEHGYGCADSMSKALLWALRADLRGEDCLEALQNAKHW